MSQRTDCHRPGAIIPADYDYLFSYAAPDRWFSVNWLDNGHDGPHSARALLGTGKLFTEKLRNCHSCGAHFRYGDIWRHRPSGKLVAFGHICSDKYGCIADRSAFERIKAAEVIKADKARKAAEAEERRRKTLTDNDGLADALLCEHRIVSDIRERFERHGYLSDAQIRLVLKLDREEKERRKQRAEDSRLHRPAPEGKQTITGEIVSTKWHDSQFGTTAKMTVKVPSDGGFFLVWSTIPAHIVDDVERYDESKNRAGSIKDLKGETVTFTATLSRGNDVHFAFAKRPSKGRIHETQAAEETAEEPAAMAT